MSSEREKSHTIDECEVFPNIADALLLGAGSSRNNYKDMIDYYNKVINKPPECEIHEDKKSDNTLLEPKLRKGVNSCSVCSSFSNLKRCKNCKKVYYCSRECQKADWRLHKNICQLCKTDIDMFGY